MSEADQTAPAPVTLAVMNGRIKEQERQRNEALARCAVLSGEKAQVLDILRQARDEIDRLNALVASTTLTAEPTGSHAAH